MKKTIQTALAPLLISGWFCSLGLFEYPFGQPRPYLTCLYFLTTWSSFAYLFYYLLYNSSTSFIYINLSYIVIIIATIVSMLVSLFRYKGLKMCLYKLSIVDDTLETLGTSKKYQRLHKWIIRIISGWIALSFSMNTIDSIWLNYEYFSISRIFVPFVGNLLFHINTLGALTWAIILGYTSSRFQRVNEHINVLYSDLLEDNADCTRRQNKLIPVSQQRTKEYKRYIWIIMQVHLQLCLISRELNKVFSVQMTVQMTSYFAFIIDLCRIIYTTYIDKTLMTMVGHVLDNIFNYIGGIVYSAIIITLNYICQAVYHKANETIVILYKLSINNRNKDLRELILQFIVQIKQTEIKFGSGLIFGYDFIRGFYKSVVTVLVIIIQMGYTYKDVRA